MNMPAQRFGLLLLLLVLLAACIAGAGNQVEQKLEPKNEKKGSAPAKIEDGKRNVAPAKVEPALKVNRAAPRRAVVVGQPVASDDNFDQWVFQQERSPAKARERLDASLALQVDYVDRACRLDDAQKKKLRLAGRGDIQRFFDRYETVKRKF